MQVFKTLFTDAPNVYGNAKQDLSRSLDKFEKSLQEAGLLLMTRVDENVVRIRNKQEGTYFFQTELTRLVKERLDILNWLSPETFSDTYDTIRSSRLKGSGKWFLDSNRFQDWVKGNSKMLIAEGMGNFHQLLNLLLISYVKLVRESRI